MNASQHLAEVRSVIDELGVLSEKKILSEQERRRNSYLLAKLSTLKSFPEAGDDLMNLRARQLAKETGLKVPNMLTSEERAAQPAQHAEIRKAAWRAFVKGLPTHVRTAMVDIERRALDIGGLWGRPSGLQYNAGSQGGYLLDSVLSDEVLFGVKQIDPLFDPNIVNLKVTESKTGLLTQPSVDLTQLSTSIVNDAVQNEPVYSTATVPAASALQLPYYSLKSTPILAAIEIEDDMGADALLDMLKKAFSFSIANGGGQLLATGNGTNQPQGVLVGAGASVYSTTTGGGVITATDINAIYFALNRAYRSSPKCAWLMTDVTYQAVRAAKDSNNRPLLNMTNDGEVLMGKPVHITPSFASANASPAVDGDIVFGDLSYFVVRVSKGVEVMRSFEGTWSQSFQALYSSILRVNSAVALASASVPAIIRAKVTH
jgi:HK97 family phage major capsid protein